MGGVAALGLGRLAGAAPSVADAINVAPGLEILPRAAWAGDLVPTGPLRAEDSRFLIVHHTAGGNSYGPDDVVGIMRGIYWFHTGPDRGWPDICYNFVIDRFGRVWEARAGSLSGPVEADATGGSQGFAQLVCLIGDFTSQLPTDEALAALRSTLAWLADRDGIDTAPGATVSFVSRGSNIRPAGQVVECPPIVGHREMSATACPGDRFAPIVAGQLISEVHALRRRPAVSPPTTIEQLDDEPADLGADQRTGPSGPSDETAPDEIMEGSVDDTLAQPAADERVDDMVVDDMVVDDMVVDDTVVDDTGSDDRPSDEPVEEAGGAGQRASPVAPWFDGDDAGSAIGGRPGAAEGPVGMVSGDEHWTGSGIVVGLAALTAGAAGVISWRSRRLHERPDASAADREAG